MIRASVRTVLNSKLSTVREVEETSVRTLLHLHRAEVSNLNRLREAAQDRLVATNNLKLSAEPLLWLNSR